MISCVCVKQRKTISFLFQSESLIAALLIKKILKNDFNKINIHNKPRLNLNSDPLSMRNNEMKSKLFLTI